MQDVRFQVKKKTSPVPLFLEPEDCDKFTTHSDTLFSFSCNHGLRKSVLQEDDILCELYANARSDVFDNSDNKSLDSDIDVPTTSSPKLLRTSTGPLTPKFPHPFFLTHTSRQFL
jgi:hypothetical protein